MWKPHVPVPFVHVLGVAWFCDHNKTCTQSTVEECVLFHCAWTRKTSCVVASWHVALLKGSQCYLSLSSGFLLLWPVCGKVFHNWNNLWSRGQRSWSQGIPHHTLTTKVTDNPDWLAVVPGKCICVWCCMSDRQPSSRKIEEVESCLQGKCLLPSCFPATKPQCTDVAPIASFSVL